MCQEQGKSVTAGRMQAARASMKIQASRELLASRQDVWGFLAEPYHLPDWWPSVGGVQPDRRRAAAGARWQVIAGREPTLFRKPETTGTLVVTAADPPSLFAFHLVADKLDVRLDLEATGSDRTRATLTVEGPWLVAYRRTLARRALSRLHALCQTAAAL